MKKILLSLVLAAMLALMGTLGFAACSQDPDQAVRAALAEDLDALKDPSSPVFQQAALFFGNLEQLGVDQGEFASVWFDGYGYEIGDVNIAGDVAVAQVELTVKHLGPAIGAGTMGSQATGDNPDGAGADAPYAQAAETLMRRMQEAPVATVSLGVAYRKTDNAWGITAEGQQALGQAIAGLMPLE
jgi:hypothetical protein